MTKRRSKLSVYKQNRLLELFVGGVTARTAAELVGVNRHSATLYYQKIRAMIAQEIEDEARQEKSRSLVCSNAAARSMPRSFLTPLGKR